LTTGEISPPLVEIHGASVSKDIDVTYPPVLDMVISETVRNPFGA
jgi:hypothetical protein